MDDKFGGILNKKKSSDGIYGRRKQAEYKGLLILRIFNISRTEFTQSRVN